MNNDQLDEVVLSVSGASWQKVAMVIARAMHDYDLGLSKEDEADLIFKRIEALVQAGRLEAQGNIQNWRFSEVRAPQSQA